MGMQGGSIPLDPVRRPTAEHIPTVHRSGTSMLVPPGRPPHKFNRVATREYVQNLLGAGTLTESGAGSSLGSGGRFVCRAIFTIRDMDMSLTVGGGQRS